MARHRPFIGSFLLSTAASRPTSSRQPSV